MKIVQTSYESWSLKFTRDLKWLARHLNNLKTNSTSTSTATAKPMSKPGDQTLFVFCQYRTKNQRWERPFVFFLRSEIQCNEGARKADRDLEVESASERGKEIRGIRIWTFERQIQIVDLGPTVDDDLHDQVEEKKKKMRNERRLVVFVAFRFRGKSAEPVISFQPIDAPARCRETAAQWKITVRFRFSRISRRSLRFLSTSRLITLFRVVSR